MKSRLFAGIAGVLLLFGVTGVSQAALEIIGTANYGPNEYNLIWQDDNNGQSLVWLDYSHTPSSWDNQSFWANLILGEVLILNINQGYTVDWGTNSWRLPSAGAHPVDLFYQTTSEMGHLFYTELGNSDRQLTNTGVFENLTESSYWYSTEFAYAADYAWLFSFNNGRQYFLGESNLAYGLAVRSGQVSAVPAPGAVWLFGCGLVSLAGISRKYRK